MEKPHGIMFHHFHDKFEHPKGQGSIDKIQFEKLIIYLKKTYKLLNAEDWYNKAIKNQLLNGEICLTFDDNLKCQYDVALPVLEKYGLTAFWFIYSSPFTGVMERLEIYRNFRSTMYQKVSDFYNDFDNEINSSNEYEKVKFGLKNFSNNYLSDFSFYSYEDKKYRYVRDNILGPKRYYRVMDRLIKKTKFNIDEKCKNLWMGENHIKNLNKKNHFICLHSHSHPTMMKSLSLKKQKNEYLTNYNILTDIINESIFCVSHPCNSYNNLTLEILNDLRIKIGFRANMKEGFISKLELPRIDHSILIQNLNL